MGTDEHRQRRGFRKLFHSRETARRILESALVISEPRALRPRLFVLVALVALGLSACTSTTASPETHSPAQRAVLPTLTASGQVDLECADLQTVLTGWTLAPNTEPGPQTPAQAAKSIGGVACVFENGAKRLAVGIAKPDAVSQQALKKYFVQNGVAATQKLSGAGYWDPTTGDAEAFRTDYWLSAVSDSFGGISQASATIQALSSALPSG